MSHTEKILIVGPAWVGDMVMAHGLFKFLKQRNNHITIDVLAPEWTFSLLSRMPEVSHAFPSVMAHGELKLHRRYKLAKVLRALQYDQAIVLPNSLKSALIPWLARIPKRTGWLGEYRYIFLNDIRYLNKQQYPLMIEQFMALALSSNERLPRNYPYPAFQVSEKEQQAALTKYNIVLSKKPILALCPGAEYGPSKRWPEEYFAEVANEKLACGWDVWLFGSQKDCVINEKIMQLTQYRCENMSGRTDLSDAIDLLSLVTFVLTNDSGLMHIAAALNKPLVATFGSTSPSFTPPLSEKAKILKLDLECQPCFERSCPLTHHRCMRELSPSMVLAAIQNIMGNE